jgi:hypothetical protein
MRLEATVPESRGQAVDQLATELGMSRSQVVDEAISVFLQVVLNARRGRRLLAVDPEAKSEACAIMTPTLAALEWTARPQALHVSENALEKMRVLITQPVEPNAQLREAGNRFKTNRIRPTNTVADGRRGRCYLVGGCWSRPSTALRKTFAARRC